MRLLLDNNLSPMLTRLPNEAGHDASHVRDYGMQAALDPEVLLRARSERRTLVSADTDFGALLAFERASTPSVILIRRLANRRADQQARIILANLSCFADDLEKGARVVLEEDSIRIRSLPIVP